MKRKSRRANRSMTDTEVKILFVFLMIVALFIIAWKFPLVPAQAESEPIYSSLASPTGQVAAALPAQNLTFVLLWLLVLAFLIPIELWLRKRL